MNLFSSMGLLLGSLGRTLGEVGRRVAMALGVTGTTAQGVTNRVAVVADVVGALGELVLVVAGLAVLAFDELAAGLLGVDLVVEMGTVHGEQTLHSVLHSTLRVDDLRGLVLCSVLTIPAYLEIVNRF